MSSERSPFKEFGEIGTIATRQKPRKRPASYGTWSANEEKRETVLGHVFAPNSRHCAKCGMARMIIDAEEIKCNS